jgi:two-component system, chemotaxis family, sensor kinase Cph1
MKPEDRDRIFAIFRRLHESNAPGNGIGLAIVQRIVQAHGGSIRVDSEPGDGSTFRFTVAGKPHARRHCPAELFAAP